MDDLVYNEEPDLSAPEFRAVLMESGLAARSPVEDEARLEVMLRRADLIVIARSAGALVGVALSLTDGVYCCYLSDLAVSKQVQGKGIGTALIEETRKRMGPRVSVILVAAPEAVTFYEKIGMPRLPASFWYQRTV